MGGKVGGMIKKLAVTAVVVSATVYAGPAVAAYLGVTGSVGVALFTAGVSMATSYAVAKLIGNNMGDTEIAQDIGSYATTTLQKDVFPNLEKTSHKILFGSDFPVCGSYKVLLDKISDANIQKEFLENIMYWNGKRLLQKVLDKQIEIMPLLHKKLQSLANNQ